jgi:hypothetical protein
MGVVFYKDKKHFNSKLKNFLKNSWTTSPPPISSKHPQREGGLYGRGYRGGPHSRGYLYISIWYPPYVTSSSYMLSMYLSLIQIYVLYFTISNF